MPDNRSILTISITAKLLGLHPRTLMFYEKNDLINPYRTDTKRRLFSIKDLNNLQFIKYLAQKEGINIQGIKILLEAIKIGKENGLNLKKRLFPSFRLKKLI